MKGMVAVAAVALAFSAWGQADKPAPKEEAKEPPKQAEMQAEMVAKRKPNPKRFEDARHCLDLPTNTEIIKCAEQYL